MEPYELVYQHKDRLTFCAASSSQLSFLSTRTTMMGNLTSRVIDYEWIHPYELVYQLKDRLTFGATSFRQLSFLSTPHNNDGKLNMKLD